MFILLLFTTIVFSCKSRKFKRRVEVISEYDNCRSVLQEIAYYWNNDTSGNNGFRSLAVNLILNNCKGAIVGMRIDDFVYNIGMGPAEEEYYNKEDRIYVYYISRIPEDNSKPIAERSKLVLIVDIEKYTIKDFYVSREEFHTK